MKISYLSLLGCLPLFLIFLSFGMQAATFTVTTLDNTDDGNCDAGHCSLREAINAANAIPNADDIVFVITGTIDLSTGAGDLPAIIATINLDGTGVTIANAFGIGLLINSTAATTSIQNLTIDNCTSHGMEVVDCPDVTINNCTFLNNGTIGAPVSTSNGNGIFAHGCSTFQFTNNTVDTNAENGVLIQNCSGGIFNANTVTNNGFHGIIVLDSPNSSFDSNNSNDNGIYNPAANGFPSSAGIGVVNSNGCTFTNNTLNGSLGEAGLYIIASSNCTATDNTTCNNLQAGIWILAGNNNTITNNNSCNNSGASTPGILISDGSSNNTIQNNTITGNQCAGVEVSGGNGNNITNNIMTDNNCPGIALTGGNSSATPPQACSITASQIDATVNGNGTIHLYQADPDSPCQGMTLIGTFPVTTGTNTLNGAFDPNGNYAMTFTNSSNNTSEFTCDIGAITPPLIPNQTTCAGSTVQLDAGSGWTNYMWSTGQTGQIIFVNPTMTSNYDVQLTNAAGCIVNAMTTVTISNSVTATIIDFSNPLCNGDANGFVTVAGGGGDGNYSYTWSPTPGNNATLGSLPEGTYNVTVMDGAGCEGTAMVQLTNPSPLGLQFTNPISPDCDLANGQITASASGGGGIFGYSWSPTGNNNSTQTGMSGGTIYTVTAQDANGCSVSDNYNFPAQTPISVDNFNQTNPVCPGSPTGSLTVFPSGGDGNYSYSWLPGGQSTNTITNLMAGTYTVEIMDGNNCSFTESYTLIDGAGMSINLINSIDPSCVDGDGEATFEVQGGDGNYTYTWSPSGGNGATGTNLSGGITYTLNVEDGAGCMTSDQITLATPTPMTVAINDSTDPSCAGVNDGTATVTINGGDGNYTIDWLPSGETGAIATSLAPNVLHTVEVSDGSGCFDTASITLNEPQAVTVNITGDLFFCENSNTELDAGADFVSYNWSNGDNAQLATVNTTGDITVTVEDANGCMGTATVNISQNNAPMPTIAGSTSFCTGSSTTLDAGGYDQYLWTGGTTEQTLEVTTTNTYFVTVTDANGCTGETNVEITESASLMPVISGNLFFCENGSTELDAGAGYAVYNWSNGDNTQLATVNTTGDITLNVEDAAGCTGSVTVNITQNNNPTPTLDAPAGFCAGDMATITISNGPFDEYEWSDTSSDPTLEVNTADNYSLIVTDANGCQGTANIDIAEFALPTVAITGDMSICEGNDETLEATSGFADYIWSTTEDTESIVVNAADTYTVTVTDANNCENTASIDLTINALPMPSITGSSTFCTGSSTTLDAGNYENYVWSTTEMTQSIDVNTEQLVEVTVTDINGCEGTTSLNITESASLMPTITGETTLCNGSSTTLDAGDGFDSYIWSNGDMTQTTEISIEETVSVTVMDASGCSGTASATTTFADALVVTITGSTEFCDGSSTTLDAGDGYDTYMWSNGDMTQTTEITAEETVSVTVTDAAGCSGTASATTSFATGLTITIDGSTEFCDGSSTILDAGAGYDTYMWSNGDMTQTTEITTEETVSVTVTDAAGCSGTASATTSFATGLTFSISGNTTFCTGGSTVLDAGVYDTYVWSTGEMTQTINADMAQMYSVTVSDAAGCSGTASINITEDNSLTPIILGDLTICENETTTLSVDGTFDTYNWSVVSDQPTITVSQSNTYGVTVTDASGCQGEADVFVNVNQNPIPTISGSASFCLGGSSTLGAGAGYDSYIWSTTEGTEDIIVTTANTYSVTVTDANMCMGEASINVMQTDTLAPNIGGDLSFCENGQTELDAGLGFATYTWSTTEGSQMITVSEPGAYSVTVSDGNGCSGSGLVNVVENTNPTPTISGEQNFCFDGETTLTVNETFANYTWSTTEQAPNITVSESDTYSLVVTDNNNCQGSADITVTEGNPVVVNITGDMEICDGESTILTADSGFNSYTWTGGAMTQTLEISAANTYNVTVIDADNCEGTADFTLSVLAEIPLTQLAPEICQGETYEVGTSSYDMTGIYLDTLAGANGCDSIIQTQLTVNQAINTTATATICNGESIFLGGAEQSTSGDYTDTYTSFNTGCDSLVVTTLTVEFCAFSSNATGSEVDCADDLGSFTITADLGTAPYTFDWELIGTGTTGNGNINTNGEVVTVDNLTAGNYSITITETASGNTVEQTAEISAPAALVSNIILNNEPACETLLDGSLTATANGGTQPYTYNWNTNLSTDETLTDLPAGEYNLVVTDLNGCTATSTQTIDYQSNINATATATGVSCGGFNDGMIELFISGNIPEPYLYSFDGENFLTLDAPINNLAAGEYHITVQNTLGCSVLVENIQVDVANELVLVLPETQTVLLGDSLRLEPQASETAETWLWTPATYLTCDTCQNTFVRPFETTTYSVTATTADGCTASALTQVIVQQNREVFIPNAFSPNDDGINDLFLINAGRSVVGVTSFQIFDRWGELIFVQSNFAPNDIDYAWNGRQNGKALNTGVYVYFAEVEYIDGSTAIVKGDVLLTK